MAFSPEDELDLVVGHSANAITEEVTSCWARCPPECGKSRPKSIVSTPISWRISTSALWMNDAPARQLVGQYSLGFCFAGRSARCCS